MPFVSLVKVQRGPCSLLPVPDSRFRSHPRPVRCFVQRADVARDRLQSLERLGFPKLEFPRPGYGRQWAPFSVIFPPHPPLPSRASPDVLYYLNRARLLPQAPFRSSRPNESPALSCSSGAAPILFFADVFVSLSPWRPSFSYLAPVRSFASPPGCAVYRMRSRLVPCRLSLLHASSEISALCFLHSSQPCAGSPWARYFFLRVSRRTLESCAFRASPLSNVLSDSRLPSFFRSPPSVGYVQVTCCMNFVSFRRLRNLRLTRM